MVAGYRTDSGYPVRRYLIEQSRHQQVPDPPAPVLGRHPDAGHSGHRRRLPTPPLPHVVEHRAAGQPVTDEGAQAPALGDNPGYGLPPLVTLGCVHGPEGSFGQVELRVDVVAGKHHPDLDLTIRMIGHGQLPYGSPAAPVTSIYGGWPGDRPLGGRGQPSFSMMSSETE
jgi:hypothetical protein